MTKSVERLFRRWSWARTGSVAINLSVATFIFGCLMARWTLAQAQETQPSKSKAPEVKQKAPKAPAPTGDRAIPAAGKKVDALALAKIIDQEIDRQLAADKIPVSPRSDDAEFLRRVYLDLVGTIPPADKAKEFLDSKDPTKRAKLIDELLADSRFGAHIGEVWAGLMLPRDINNRRLDHNPMKRWLADSFNSDKPLNKTVYELLTSLGEPDTNGATTFFVYNNSVDKVTDNVSRMFLGVQLQCAQCHNHPFVDYKQTEYWGMAAFFTKVRLTGDPGKAAKKAGPLSVSESNVAPKGKGKGLPMSAKIVPARFLQGEQPKMNAGEPARPVLASWLTTAKNPFFAKAMVNRFWYQLFGRGLVNPVDDMHDDNYATHPELLAALSEQFGSNGFDTKYLIRAICNSEAYQRTSKPTGTNKEDTVSYSHRLVRVLSPEQLYDSIVVAVGRVDKGGTPLPMKKMAKGAPLTVRDNFTNFFRIDEGANPLEYQVGIPQALRLMNSPQLNSNSEAVNQAMKAGSSPAGVIESLFLRTLSRRPSAHELERFTGHVKMAADPRSGYGDVVWVLLNSSEFTFNH